MKGLFYLTIVTLLLTANTFAQYIDSIKNYPGIPIITYGYEIYNYPDSEFVNMANAGIFALQAANLNPTDFQRKILNTGMKVLPEQIKDSLLNYIVKYTEARYTEFEAEEVPNKGVTVSLYSDSLPNLKVENGFVSTTDSTPHGTMIYGPMYRQCRNYTEIGNDSIVYTASYIFKVDDIIPHQSSANDTICEFLVTSTKTWENTYVNCNGRILQYQPYVGFGDTIVHNRAFIRYGDIHPGRLDTVNIEYYFPRDVSTWYREEPQYNIRSNILSQLSIESGDGMNGKISQNCVEFKVVWKGDPQRVKLSIDKIVVSDQRGRDLKDPTSSALLDLNQQIGLGQSLYGNRLAGWIGMDEPWSLDTWEPIRIVQNILEDHNASLWFQFNVQHNGRFRPWEDPALGSKVNMIDEFMRRVGKANVFITQTKDSFLIFLGNKPKTPLINQF